MNNFSNNVLIWMNMSYRYSDIVFDTNIRYNNNRLGIV